MSKSELCYNTDLMKIWCGGWDSHPNLPVKYFLIKIRFNYC
jgi:hypothetical protein